MLTNATVHSIIYDVHGMTLIAVFAALVSQAIVARAAIYSWHDEQGVTHYVDDLESVPAEYRQQVVTVVKDLPARAAPSEEASLPPAELPAPRVSAADPLADGSFQQGFQAGVETGFAEAQPKVVPASVGPIVQSVEIIQPEPTAPAFVPLFPFFGRVLVPAVRLRPRHPFVPRNPDRFLQGPAGPPPFGAAGPPPLMFGR